jgi:large subunit ribosomal protein L6
MFMSKIGKQVIMIPQGVEVTEEGRTIKVSGPKGVLSLKLPKTISLEIDRVEGKMKVSKKDACSGNEFFGTTRAHLANMVKGVSSGWVKTLELVGTGYRGETNGKKLTINVGYSHPIIFDAPEGISFKIEKTDITIEGPDKEVVGQIAANIRKVRPPEPYKGKGIKYKDEVIRRKAGKAAKTAGAPA